LELYNIIMKYRMEDLNGVIKEYDYGNIFNDFDSAFNEDDFKTSMEKASMEKAKDIMDMLENDSELMSNFNFLLRQKKLKQLKTKIQ
jgi:hypothetical protein